MKKLLALLVALFLCTFAAAEVPADAVYVSISDATGTLVMAREPVQVTDVDADGALTISDALAAAHAACHPEGSSAFAAGMTEYGLSLMKLWGDESGAFGYYRNNASAWSLADPVQPGDHVKAFVYVDQAAWSDAYCFFATDTVDAKAGEAVALTLSAAGYDEMWNPVVLPVCGAALTMDGVPADALTDVEGAAQLTFATPGVYVISAASQTQTLVPPVCIVTVTE